MLEANINNSKATTIACPIKLTIKDVIPNLSFGFKAMVIVACKALENNKHSLIRLVNFFANVHHVVLKTLNIPIEHVLASN
jgi:hypothetical protein